MQPPETGLRASFIRWNEHIHQSRPLQCDHYPSMGAAATTRCERSGAWDRKQSRSQLWLVKKEATTLMSTDVLRKNRHPNTAPQSIPCTSRILVGWSERVVSSERRWETDKHVDGGSSEIVENQGSGAKVLMGAQKTPPQVSSSFTALPKGIMREWYLGVPGIGRGWATGNTSCGSNSH